MQKQTSEQDQLKGCCRLCCQTESQEILCRERVAAGRAGYRVSVSRWRLFSLDSSITAHRGKGQVFMEIVCVPPA
jgi:hypothetical protein